MAVKAMASFFNDEEERLMKCEYNFDINLIDPDNRPVVFAMIILSHYYDKQFTYDKIQDEATFVQRGVAYTYEDFSELYDSMHYVYAKRHNYATIYKSFLEAAFAAEDGPYYEKDQRWYDRVCHPIQRASRDTKNGQVKLLASVFRFLMSNMTSTKEISYMMIGGSGDSIKSSTHVLPLCYYLSTYGITGRIILVDPRASDQTVEYHGFTIIIRRMYVESLKFLPNDKISQIIELTSGGEVYSARVTHLANDAYLKTSNLWLSLQQQMTLSRIPTMLKVIPHINDYLYKGQYFEQYHTRTERRCVINGNIILEMPTHARWSCGCSRCEDILPMTQFSTDVEDKMYLSIVNYQFCTFNNDEMDILNRYRRIGLIRGAIMHNIHNDDIILQAIRTDGVWDNINANNTIEDANNEYYHFTQTQIAPKNLKKDIMEGYVNIETIVERNSNKRLGIEVEDVRKLKEFILPVERPKYVLEIPGILYTGRFIKRLPTRISKGCFRVDYEYEPRQYGNVREIVVKLRIYKNSELINIEEWVFKLTTD